MLDDIALDLVLVVAVPVLAVLALVVRRRVLTRDAGFDMCVRVRRDSAARGWAFGVGRYQGDALQWFRTFSVWPRPSREFRRDALRVLARRDATEAERSAIPAGHVVVECLDESRTVDLTMSESALTGMLAWKEAAPPGRGLVA